MRKNNNEMARIEKAIRELVASQKKTDEQQKKTEEMLKKTDEEITKLTRKTDAEITKLLRTQENINKQVANITDSWGKFVEGFIEPSIPELFSRYGIKDTSIFPRAKSHKNGEELEVDILAVSKKEDNIVIAVEAKTTLGIRDVNDCISDLNKFFDFFDVYSGRKLIGVVCGIRLPGGVAKYAEKKGLYIMRPSGENMTILNRKGFRPKIWKVKRFSTKVKGES